MIARLVKICNSGLVTLFLGFALSVSAATMSVPENSFTIFDVLEPSEPDTFYGQLSNFPHTYQFEVSEPIQFSAQLETHESVPAGTDLSLILVKKVKRGVEEIGRVNGRKIEWHKRRDNALAVNLSQGEEFNVELQPGSYKLEVSTPENISPYRLMLNKGARPSYNELFMIRNVFNLSKFGVLFSYYVYIPFLTLLVGLLYLKLRKSRSLNINSVEETL